MSNIPTYEEFTEGRKLTAKQHAARRKKYDELYNNRKEDDSEPAYRPGRCECSSGSFKLSMRNREMYRTCKVCGAERKV